MFRTIYNHRDDQVAYATINEEPSLTQQSDAKDADINVIMKRYGGTGQLPQLTVQPMYGDFSEVTDYRDAVERVQAADKMFKELPAKVRKEFDNDPAKFLAFTGDPNNAEELTKMGLAIKRVPDKIEPKTPEQPVPPKTEVKKDE